MSNIAEGFERGRPTEFHQFLSVAKGSCAELRSQLYVALDVGYVIDDDFRALMTQAIEVGQILGGLRFCGAQAQHAKSLASLLITQYSSLITVLL